MFGPEILLNCRSGAACIRADDGQLCGTRPDLPVTNAFAVWVGSPVIVVSEGVGGSDAAVVASALREVVALGDVSVVFNRERLSASKVRAIADRRSTVAGRDIARAEAYVLVECAWVEADMVSVELDGESFDFRVRFEPGVAGRFTPVVS